MDIVKRIHEIRKAKKLSVYKLAKLCKVSRNTIYKWDNENYYPSLETLQLICENGFNMSLADFFTYGDEIIIANDDTKELLKLYSTLTDAQKEAVKQLIISYRK